MNGTSELSFLDISTTYVDWKSPFSQVLLASNGFKYTGRGDTVECVSCGVKLGNWKEGDNVPEKHFKAFPDCKYCKNYSDIHKARLVAESRPTRVNIGHNRGQSRDNSLVADEHQTRNMDADQSQRPARSEFVPNRSENRLPVPVNIIQPGNNGSVFRFNPAKQVERSDSDESGTNLQQQKTMPKAQIAQYQEESARLASYENWPDSAPVKPPALARAGLYYTGMSDKAKCAFCLGAMYNWEKGDVPFSEHSRHYPNCQFVKYKMYQSLFSDTSSENTTQQRVVVDAIPEVPAPATPNGVNQAVAAGGLTENFEENKSVLIVHDMGFSMDLIKKAFRRIPNATLATVKSAALIDTLYDMEEDDDTDKPEDKSTPQSHSVSVIGEANCDEDLMRTSVAHDNVSEGHDSAEFAGGNHPPTGTNFSAIKPESDSPTSSMSQLTPDQPRKPVAPHYKKLSDEHRQLSNRKICSVCHEDQVSVLFLPCRHLVACETCSAKLKNCSQCDKLIIGTVKIFFP